MNPFAIRPITLNAATAQLHAHLLYAARYLQIPGGRAFLLLQIRRRNLLLPHACATHHAEDQVAQLKCGGRAFLAGPGRDAVDSPAIIPRGELTAKRPDMSPLDLVWPRDTHEERIVVLVEESYAPERLSQTGNLFEVFI